MEIKAIEKIEGLSGSHRDESILSYAGPNPFLDQPDLHLLAIERSEVLACCSLWWNNCPELDNERIGCIGHFFAIDEESGTRVLRDACHYLKQLGSSLAVGPMNGNTWRKYRFVTDSGTDKPFALEPENPDWWPELWMRFGFSKLAGYHSSIIEDLNHADPRIDRASDRLSEAGVAIRELNLDDYDQELSRIFTVSERAFENNYLYTPISENDFLEMYRPFRDFADPRFALIAERSHRPIGFVFSYPNLSKQQRPESCDTLIIKTLATLLSREWAGLGAVLVDRIRKAAVNSGMKRVIHALMHDSNNSANIGKNSRIFRRYTLFSKRLGA